MLLSSFKLLAEFISLLVIGLKLALFVFFWGGGLHPQHMEVPRPGLESEL